MHCTKHAYLSCWQRLIHTLTNVCCLSIAISAAVLDFLAGATVNASERFSGFVFHPFHKRHLRTSDLHRNYFQASLLCEVTVKAVLHGSTNWSQGITSTVCLSPGLFFLNNEATSSLSSCLILSAKANPL